MYIAPNHNKVLKEGRNLPQKQAEGGAMGEGRETLENSHRLITKEQFSCFHVVIWAGAD